MGEDLMFELIKIKINKKIITFYKHKNQKVLREMYK